MPDHLQFLLVPDSSSARSVRRALASEGARCGIVAGRWEELLEQAKRAYLVSPGRPDWEARLARAAGELADGFWSASLEVDPEVVLKKIDSELRRLLEALGPGKSLGGVAASGLSERGKRHLAGLARLHEAMGEILPEELEAIRVLLSTENSEAVRRIVVHRAKGIPPLSPWQDALLAKLAADSAGGTAGPENLDAFLTRALDPAPGAREGSALRRLQDFLYLSESSQEDLDDSFICIGVRDPLEAAETAAGMAQRALRERPGLSPSKIGLLLPADRSCHGAVREVFRKAGLPLSGLEDPGRLRNLGGEAVLQFLATRRKPAPAMALAAVYSSPLMPWDEVTGCRMAMEIMRGRFDFGMPEGLSPEGRRMAGLIRARHESPAALIESLREFGSLLSAPDSLERHAETARSAIESLLDSLRRAEGPEIRWEELSSIVPQNPMRGGVPTERTLEGIAVLVEDEEPWRGVDLLFVLGFNEGRFPAGTGRSPVFDAADEDRLKEGSGVSLVTAEEGMARRRARFVRQLRRVRDRVVILVPMKDGEGKETPASGTIAFMTRLFRGIRAPEDLLLMLEREDHREKIPGLPAAPPADAVDPLSYEIIEPELSGDLLADETGKMRHLTPSGQETLMVSPLAWFLARHDVEPLSWAPETLDPATKGMLAHHVFEKLFPAGPALPTAAGVESSVERFFNEGVHRMAPFLTGSEWYVERRNLLKEIETAALRWREMLEAAGATILGVEVGLGGIHDGIPVRGRTDLLLSLPPGRLFVVDYKKSGSATRRKCMENGYDLQTSLYRRMLRTGRVDGDPGGAIGRALEAKAEIGVLYYMMDDQKALTDTSGWPRTVSDIFELGGGISVNGDALVKERILALRAGKIPLNTENDEERFRRLGVKTFALGSCPLVSRFLLPAPEAEEAQ